MTKGQPLRVLPWRLVAFLVLVIAATLGLSWFIAGKAHLAATVAGLMVGLIGSLLGSGRAAALATMVLLGAMALHIQLPDRIPTQALAMALVVLAGAEAGIVGGRAMTLALFGFLKLSLLPAMPPGSADLPFVAGAALLGGVAVLAIGLQGRARQAPGGLPFGAGVTLFLGLGLLGIFWIVQRMDQPFAYWLALLFVWRAMAPPERTMGAALRFGTGAVLGSLLAMLATFLDLPAEARLALTLALVIAGLRMLPHPGPWTPAAFTSAVLLSFANGPGDALFRAEAALFILALTALLTLVLSTVWQLIAGGRAQGQPSKL
jgi:hypothetical protein